MVKIVELYDKGGPAEGNSPAAPPQILQRSALAAQEAVAHDPERYSLTRPRPWPPSSPVPVVAPARAGRPARVRAPSAGTGDPAEKAAVIPDPFTQITGIGPAIAGKLRASGIDSFRALSEASPEALAAAAATPGKTPEAIVEADWKGQAFSLIDTDAGTRDEAPVDPVVDEETDPPPAPKE